MSILDPRSNPTGIDRPEGGIFKEFIYLRLPGICLTVVSFSRIYYNKKIPLLPPESEYMWGCIIHPNATPPPPSSDCTETVQRELGGPVS